jgi:hypothetical protein
MDATFKDAIDKFLQSSRIAIVGYSRNKDQPANAVYDRFQNNGYDVYAVNCNNEGFEGVEVFARLSDIPERPDGAVIFTPPKETPRILEECANLGIVNVWIHRSVDAGSWSPEVTEFSKKHLMNVIPVGCPLMFLKPDFPHLCIRTIMNWTGKLKIGERAEVSAV